MTTAFEAYKEYVALKNHFTKPSYDYFKYNGKMRLNPASFETRGDKLFFQKLAKKDNVHDFLVANFSQNEKMWIRDLAYNDEADRTYKSWLKRQQSLAYTFTQDLSKLNENFDSNFICKSHEHPPLLKLFLSKEISAETFCILLYLTGANKHWDKKLEYDPVWKNISFKYHKYVPFLNIDKDKYKKIIVDKYRDLD